MRKDKSSKKRLFEDLVALHQSIVSSDEAEPAQEPESEKRPASEQDDEPADNRFELVCDFFPMGIMLAEVTRDRYRHPQSYKPVNVNKEYARLLGLARVTVLERDLFEVLPGGEEWRDSLTEVITKGRTARGISYWEATDSRIQVTLFLPRRDLLAVVIEDVAQRADESESVGKHELLIDDVMRISTDLVCRFLPDGTLTYANRAYCEFFKKVREELVGHCFADNIPTEDVDFVRSMLSTLTRFQPKVTYQNRFDIEGVERWVEWTDIAIFDDSGALVEYQSHGRDVTETRRSIDEAERVSGYMEDLLEFFAQQQDSSSSEATQTKASAAKLSGELSDLRKEIERLRSLTITGDLKICSSCHRVHDDEGHWMVVPLFLESHTSARVGTQVCPYCRTKAERDLERKRNMH